MKTAKSFVEELLQLVPELKPAYTEHIADNDALLPHVFFGDVTRFAIAEANKCQGPSALIRLLDQMESGLRTGSEEVGELIAVSFVENLCGEEDALKRLRPLMGSRLNQQVKAICGE